MDWVKKGLIYAPDGSGWWSKKAAMIPTPELLDEDRIRIYLSFCDSDGIGRPGFVDISAEDPKTVVGVSEEPLLDIGEPGTFDENGAVVCSVVKLPDGKRLMYYVGFELGRRIRYRMLTGLAKSDAEGMPFKRVKRTPVLERSDAEPFFRCGPFVMRDDGVFRMWYVGGGSWVEIEGKSMPVYVIKYIESENGLDWPAEGRICMAALGNEEYGFGRPYVIKDGSLYRMFYSIRLRGKGYRLGYAESSDGINWVRKDNELGLNVSGKGWDSEMVCYSSLITVRGRTYMFYNGNGFGNSGFGYAELKRW